MGRTMARHSGSLAGDVQIDASNVVNDRSDAAYPFPLQARTVVGSPHSHLHPIRWCGRTIDVWLSGDMDSSSWKTHVLTVYRKPTGESVKDEDHAHHDDRKRRPKPTTWLLLVALV
jgi:hypothetical protein